MNKLYFYIFKFNKYCKYRSVVDRYNEVNKLLISLYHLE